MGTACKTVDTNNNIVFAVRHARGHGTLALRHTAWQSASSHQHLQRIQAWPLPLPLTLNPPLTPVLAALFILAQPWKAPLPVTVKISTISSPATGQGAAEQPMRCSSGCKRVRLPALTVNRHDSDNAGRFGDRELKSQPAQK